MPADQINNKTMTESAWDDSQVMMNGATTRGGPMQAPPGGRHRTSQDDAMVGYFFQRPQNEPPGPQYTKRWAVGDDSRIDQVQRGMTVSELERDFHSMTFDREIGPHTKKIWDLPDNEQQKQAVEKDIFVSAGSPWTPRDDTWSTSGTSYPNEHAVSQPINMVQRRPGSFPSSEANNVLSPRSSEASALGVNMVEYVLGSPSSKEIDRMRMKGYVPQVQGDPNHPKVDIKQGKPPSPFEPDKNVVDVKETNGMIQNGVDDDKVYRSQPQQVQPGKYMVAQPAFCLVTRPHPGAPGGAGGNNGSRQTSPQDDEVKQQQMIENQRLMMGGAGKPEDLLQGQPQLMQPGLQLDAPQFDPQLGIDPVQFDYSNPIVPSMDSPNFGGMDYNQQMQMQRQQPIAVLTPQQYAAAQQQQLGTSYVINAGQDPYAVGIPVAGPAVVGPQYYSVPWGIYPANIVQQGQNPQGGVPQQQQLIRNQQGRPLTPSQQDQIGSQNNGSVQQIQTPENTVYLPGAGYQILAPAYYDQNGQLVMGNARGIGTPVRLVSPAPVLVSGAAGQQAYTGNSNLGYTSANNNLLTAAGNNPQQTGYGNSNTPQGGIGSEFLSGLSNRRDSLSEYKLNEFKRSQMPMNQYYNSMGGGASGSPAAGPMGLVQSAQSLTPPPSLSGSNSNLSLGGKWWSSEGLGGSGSRGYSAAPGAEAKYRAGLTSSSPFFGNGIFNTRNMARGSSLSKEVTVGRSRLLEDFRNNRIPNLQLKDLVNHVVEFSQDQHGSRFIQQKLERATPAEKAMVFNEILTAAYSLMTDVFGNYVIQKFFEFGTPDQKQTLAQRVRGHVLPLALQMYGCRVIQKALESIPPDMQVEIVKELDGHVLKCVKDQNGNHVVQKCIECVDPKHLQFIIDAFKGQVFTLSTHPYGCRVIQRILEHCTPEQTTPILEELHEHTERLVQDQYGNYVIQHVLEHGRPEDKSKIVNMLRGQILVLAQHKFASNVVEKCVSHSSRSERALLIDEVCSMNDGPHSALYTMMKDQFANYVVQKMIDVAEPPQRKILMHKIRPHVGTLRKYTYGKHILAKLEKFFMKNTELGPIGMPPNGSMQ
ncbi:pumilio homolog 1-like [Tubulanus polymorphus]|uniref:pumilio homolog 1-like n=1 Tax=Tubulanus polymorphus TaxID=672921 RepID=UPI003DA3E19B